MLEAASRHQRRFCARGLAPLLAIACAIGLSFLRPEALAIAAPVLLLWLLSPLIVWWFDRPPARRRAALTAGQVVFLRRLARRTWSFFELNVTAADLLRPSLGTITQAGFNGNVEVCVHYLAAWLDGNGCVPIHGMMEDAATAEIARAQLWQWLHFADDGRDPLALDDGTPVNDALLERALIGLPSRLANDPSVVGRAHVDTAIALLSELTHRDTLEDFLTLPAYDRID